MARESCAELLQHALGLLHQVLGDITDHHPEFKNPDQAHFGVHEAIVHVENVLTQMHPDNLRRISK